MIWTALDSCEYWMCSCWRSCCWRCCRQEHSSVGPGQCWRPHQHQRSLMTADFPSPTNSRHRSRHYSRNAFRACGGACRMGTPQRRICRGGCTVVAFRRCCPTCSLPDLVIFPHDAPLVRLPDHPPTTSMSVSVVAAIPLLRSIVVV